MRTLRSSAHPILETVVWTFVAVAVSSAIQLYLIHQGLISISWDGSARTVVAYKWMLNKYVFRPSAWLPFHRILVGLTLQFWRDLIVAPRFVSYVFGLLSIGSVMWLSWELFADRRSAILSGILSALLAHRLVLAIVPLSSIVFSAVAISGLALATRWFRSGGSALLCLTGLVFGISSSIRYEGWLISGVFLCVASGLVLVRNPANKIRGLLIAAILMAAFPTVWMTMHFVASGDALGFWGPGSTEFPLKTTFLKNPLIRFLRDGLHTGMLIGVVSLATRLPNNVNHRLTAVTAFAPLLVVSGALLISCRAQSGPSWRMVCFWLLALAPFAGDTIQNLLKSNRTSARIAATGLIGLLALASLNLADTIRQNSAWVFPPTDRAVGSYVGDYLQREPTSRILIESRRSWYLNVMVASQRPEAFVPNEGIPGLDGRVVISSKDIWKGSDAESRNLRLLVFRSADHKRARSQDPDLRHLDTFGPWSVYEIETSLETE